MTKKIYLSLVLFSFFFNSFSQPNSRLTWALNIYNSGNREFMFNPMPNSALLDRDHSSIFFIPVHDSLRIENQWFLRSDNINYVVAKFDSTGKVIWVTPIKGKYSKTGIYASAILQNGSVIFSSAGEDSVRIDRLHYSSPGTFRYTASLDLNGKIIRIIGDLSVTICRPAFGNYSLMLAEVLPPDTLFPGNFKYDGIGTYLLRMNSDFIIVSSLKISSNSISSNYEDLSMDNRYRIFISAVSNKSRVLEFQDTVYPYTYQAATPFSVTDYHLFCIDTMGNKLWHLRIDSCSDGGNSGIRYIAPLFNDRLIYIPYYSRSLNILGNSVYVKYRGGRYPYIIYLNSNTGKVINSIYSDSVEGGELDFAFALSDIVTYNKVFIRTLSKTGYHKWKGLPDSVKNFYGRMMMVADTGLNFTSFCLPVEVPRNNDFHPFVYSQMTALKPSDVQYDYAGYSFSNKGGYDYFIGVCGPPSMKAYNRLSSLSLWDLTVYPNPGSGIIHIENDLPSGTIFTMYNSLGVKVYRHDINSGQRKIQTNQLEAGMYYLEFYHPEKGRSIIKYMQL